MAKTPFEKTNGNESSRAMRRSPGCAAMAALVILSLCLVAIFPAGIPTASAQQIPTVRCDPLSAFGNVGEELVVDLYVEDVVDMYGVDLQLNFDPTIAEVLDQDLGLPGTQIQPLYTFTLPPLMTIIKSADNVNGTIRYVMTQLNPSPDTTGSGPVARITFLGLQEGSFPMLFSYAQLARRGGVPIVPINVLDCTVTIGPPLAVTMGAFQAIALGDDVQLEWETTSEIDNMGFNLYRSLAPDAPQSQLNDTLIPSQSPGNSQGAAYRWLDTGLEENTYFYWLEDVSMDGSISLHGPVSAEIEGPTAVTLSDLSVISDRQQNPLNLAAVIGLIAIAWFAIRTRRYRSI